MKLIDILSSEERAKIDKLIKEYDEKNEFEVSMFNNKETSNNFYH